MLLPQLPSAVSLAEVTAGHSLLTRSHVVLQLIAVCFPNAETSVKQYFFFPNQKPFEVVTFVVSGVKQRSSGCLWEAGWSAVTRDRCLTASHPCVSHRTSALFSEAGEAEKLRFLLCRQKKGGDIGNVSQGAP